jgi:hypothetical protein
LKLNGTHQFLVFADDVNLLGKNTIIKNVEVVIDAGKDVDVEVSTEKTRCIGQNQERNIGIKSFDNVA